VLKKRLESSLKLNVEYREQIKNLHGDITDLTNQKDKLQNDLNNASDYILSMEGKVYKSNNLSLELLKEL